jgi:hypothetical protein
MRALFCWTKVMLTTRKKSSPLPLYICNKYQHYCTIRLDHEHRKTRFYS